jgi:hypothetical protein
MIQSEIEAGFAPIEKSGGLLGPGVCYQSAHRARPSRDVAHNENYSHCVRPIRGADTGKTAEA